MHVPIVIMQSVRFHGTANIVTSFRWPFPFVLTLEKPPTK